MRYQKSNLETQNHKIKERIPCKIFSWKKPPKLELKDRKEAKVKIITNFNDEKNAQCSEK